MRADSEEPLMLGVPAQGAASGGVPGPADGRAPVGIVARALWEDRHRHVKCKVSRAGGCCVGLFLAVVRASLFTAAES